VSTTADSLPNDLESLRALAAQVIAERDAAIVEREAAIKERDAERAERAKLAAERDRLQSLYEHVHHLLRTANDHRFGARSERLDRLPADQLQLALEDIEASLAKTEAIEEKKEPRLPRAATRKRGALPEHLPRIHETVAPKSGNCPCEETSERLDVVPAQYRVIVTHRPKFACRACEKVVQENAPERLTKSGLPTEAMVASVWTMARDDRPFGGTDPPAVAYTYAPGRGAVHLHTPLRDYRGIVQCDGYTPYKQLPDDAVTLAFCWAHVRRGSSRSPGKAMLPLRPRHSCASPRSLGSAPKWVWKPCGHLACPACRAKGAPALRHTPMRSRPCGGKRGPGSGRSLGIRRISNASTIRAKVAPSTASLRWTLGTCAGASRSKG
jgi:hypothetical protein